VVEHFARFAGREARSRTERVAEKLRAPGRGL
jgi:hypothetical protein